MEVNPTSPVNSLADFDNLSLIEQISKNIELDAVIKNVNPNNYELELFYDGFQFDDDGNITNEPTKKGIIGYCLNKNDVWVKDNLVTIKMLTNIHAIILPPRLPKGSGKYYTLMIMDNLNPGHQMFEKPRFV